LLRIVNVKTCLWICRQKHREEVLKLKQELQALQSTSKGGQQATDRTKKELEKTRCAVLASPISLSNPSA